MGDWWTVILPNSTLPESLKWTFMIYYVFYMSPSSSDLVVVAEENKTSVFEGGRGWCRCHFLGAICPVIDTLMLSCVAICPVIDSS
jgi:hypothetical protein